MFHYTRERIINQADAKGNASILIFADFAKHDRRLLDEAAAAALETLWNPETGIYENRDAVTGAFSHRISGNTVEWADGQEIAPHELYELSFPA